MTQVTSSDEVLLAVVQAVALALAGMLGWWLKARMDSAARLQVDRVLEEVRAELRRGDVLASERLTAFKELQQLLRRLERYCVAHVADLKPSSEFEARPDTLPPVEARPLLAHWDGISRKLDEKGLFMSPTARAAFDALLAAMNPGFSMEVHTLGDTGLKGSEPVYESIAAACRSALDALYADLDFGLSRAGVDRPAGRLEREQ